MTDTALRKLAGSVIWPGFTGLTAPRWLLGALDDGLAGAVYFSHNIDPDDPGSVRRLSAQIHDANPDSLIGVDEEGGTVTRLEAAHGSSVPGNAVLGRVDDVDTTERVAAWIGGLVASAGIDIDLAPTVDVNADPRNPVIGVRSFSAETSVVSRHAAASVRGIQSAGVAACAKHFPGHGDTTSDSHLEAAVSDIDEQTLRAVHLPPFAAAIEAGVKAIMCAHIRLPFLGHSPATINHDSLRLARDMGFEGVMVTDALDMAAIRATVGSGPGAVAALNAGADLLCTGNPFTNATAASDGTADELEFREVHGAVYEALRSGELGAGRVEEAAARVRELAAWTAGQRRSRRAPAAARTADGVEVAARGIDSTGDVRICAPILVIDARPRRTIAVGDAPDFFTAALQASAGGDAVTRVIASGPNADAASELAASAAASAGGDVVLLVSSPQTDDVEAAAQAAVLRARPRAVVVHAGWPGDLPRAAREVRTFGASRVSAEAVADLLLGRRR